ncbi:hypothetical protein [Lunatimonas salinarum]|uniref:hypothetical protein n=1 Tax=Lunatimonas salinarum TaxID=1774590 RepID=UPI001AE02AE2|nr:hypothetical protein [Lunatimonas salinarum]
MKRNYLFYAILLVVIGVIAWVIADTVSMPGVGDLHGQYEELAFERNENNTGPVVRIYLVYTPETDWEEMEAYGNFMPHTKYGITRIFFVNERLDKKIELALDEPHISEDIQKICIGRYDKSPMGQVSLRKFPFGEL